MRSLAAAAPRRLASLGTQRSELVVPVLDPDRSAVAGPSTAIPAREPLERCAEWITAWY